MQQKQVAVRELRKILEDGYRLQQEQDVFQVYRVPRSNEPGFDKSSIFKYLHFGADGSVIYNSYTTSIKNAFENFGLSFGRFRSNTESINPKTDPDSPAGLFLRQLRELDKIINDEKYFHSYILPEENPVISFIDGIIAQGYRKHKFKYDQHLELIHILWEKRRIIDTRGKILKIEQPIPREIINKKLNIEHERFKGIVRAINIEMRRKNIQLVIKFPKNVYVVATQDSV